MGKQQSKGKHRAPQSASNAFHQTVSQTPEIASCFQVGFQALGSYSSLVSVKDTAKICGSVELDVCVLRLYPQDNRWDFILCYDSKVYFMEVHSAYTGEVSTMIKKFNWLKTWLHEKAPALKALCADQPFHWIQSGKFGILKTSKQFRQLEQMNLLPKKELRLP